MILTMVLIKILRILRILLHPLFRRLISFSCILIFIFTTRYCPAVFSLLLSNSSNTISITQSTSTWEKIRAEKRFENMQNGMCGIFNEHMTSATFLRLHALTFHMNLNEISPTLVRATLLCLCFFIYRETDEHVSLQWYDIVYSRVYYLIINL